MRSLELTIRQDLASSADLVQGPKFGLLLTTFLLLTLASWPILLSFELWVIYDRGSLLNLDRLWSEGLTPAVDVFYSYGLLPVLLQRVAFSFGRGYWPMIVCTFLALPVLALIWSVLLRGLPRSPAWMAAVICSAPMILWVNPNFPYTLVLISMFGALACVMEERADLALALCAVGCWSVPSLPLLLAALVLALIVLRWWESEDHSIASLLRAVAPGALSYAGLGLLLALIFGVQAVLNTALPIRGAEFYSQRGWGLSSIVEFLKPQGAGITWLLFTRSGWWIFSSLLLMVLALRDGTRMARSRALDTRGCVVIILAVLHLAFVFIAPGSPQQHLVYDPILVAAVLIGLSGLSPGKLRGGLLACFSLLALTGNAWQIRDTWRAWHQHASAEMAGLYATSELTAEWQNIVRTAADHPLLLLTYGTGAHHYFPSIQSPRVWFLEVGQLLPGDKARVLAQIQSAQIVVVGHDSHLEAYDPRFRDEVTAMCLVKVGKTYDIWRRRSSPTEKCAAPLEAS